MAEQIPIRITRREVLSDGWFRLERITFEQIRKDGSAQAVAREVCHNGPGAAVLPIDSTRGTALLVRQVRVAVHVNGDPPALLEACAGIVEDGDDPAATVCKEAGQELGCRLRELRPVATLYMSPGASAEKLRLFTAVHGEGDRIGRGGGLRDEGEQIEVVEFPLARAWEMADSGRIMDAKTVLLLQHARLS